MKKYRTMHSMDKNHNASNMSYGKSQRQNSHENGKDKNSSDHMISNVPNFMKIP